MHKFRPLGPRIGALAVICCLTPLAVTAQLPGQKSPVGVAPVAPSGPIVTPPLIKTKTINWPALSLDTCKVNNPRSAGSKIAYSNGEIYVMNSDGSGKTKLTNMIVTVQGNVQQRPISPQMSPDGTKVAFVRVWFEFNPPIPYGVIYVISVNGTSLARLSSDERSQDYDPQWSPDGSRIVFTTFRNNAYGETYVMNADGSAQTRITNNSLKENNPTWSPDGTKFAFSRHVNGKSDIFVMNSDGSGQTNLTNGPQSVHSIEPDWCPSGARIAFSRATGTGSNETPTSNIHTMNPDGSDQVPLTFLSVSAKSPSWSPDGLRIAFHRFNQAYPPVNDANDGIYVMSAARGAQTKIAARTQDHPVAHASW